MAAAPCCTHTTAATRLNTASTHLRRKQTTASTLSGLHPAFCCPRSMRRDRSKKKKNDGALANLYSTYVRKEDMRFILEGPRVGDTPDGLQPRLGA